MRLGCPKLGGHEARGHAQAVGRGPRAERPDFQVRFHWQPNSVAFWDNHAVQHLAVWDYYPHVRSGSRVMIKGQRFTA